jgi:hypothetical protein
MPNIYGMLRKNLIWIYYLLSVFLQKLVMDLFCFLPISEHAKAYGKGCSIKRNAELHLNSKHILHGDIKNFFDTIDKNHSKNKGVQGKNP